MLGVNGDVPANLDVARVTPAFLDLLIFLGAKKPTKNRERNSYGYSTE